MQSQTDRSLRKIDFSPSREAGPPTEASRQGNAPFARRPASARENRNTCKGGAGRNRGHYQSRRASSRRKTERCAAGEPTGIEARSARANFIPAVKRPQRACLPGRATRCAELAVCSRGNLVKVAAPDLITPGSSPRATKALYQPARVHPLSRPPAR